MNRYLNELASILDKSSHDILDKKTGLYGRLLFAEITLLGILVSFPSAIPLNIFSRCLFAFAVFSLGVGILCGIIVLRGEIVVLEKSQKRCVREYREASKEGREVRPVWEGKPKFYTRIEQVQIATTIIAVSVLTTLLLLRTLNI